MMSPWPNRCPAPRSSGSEVTSITGKVLFHLRFRKLPWRLALDVEGAFHPCNISSKETNYRGDNSYETDMARPFRISHRCGRGQDFDRSVSVRYPVQGQRMERLPYRQELDTG